jgi:hypothetical protein
MIVNLCGLLFHDRNGRGEWKSCRPTTPLTHDEARSFAVWARAYRNNEKLAGELPKSATVLQDQISLFRSTNQPAQQKPKRHFVIPEPISVEEYWANIEANRPRIYEIGE